MKRALFIGRFQPFHDAHLTDIKNILRECDEVIIAIGSSQEGGTERNPFSFEKRKEMIGSALLDENIKADILAVPDISNDKKWVDHVINIVGDFDVAYTGNEYVAKLFEEKNVPVARIKLIPGINATIVRRTLLAKGNWRKYVPKMVAGIIEKIFLGRGLHSQKEPVRKKFK